MGERWKPIEPTAWTAIGYTLEMGSSHKWKMNWESIYGELPPGDYRFCKEFSAYRAPGDYDTKVYYAEFEAARGMTSRVKKDAAGLILRRPFW